MGIHPKIGITGLPRSGKSAVLAKVLRCLKKKGAEKLTLEVEMVQTPTLLEE